MGLGSMVAAEFRRRRVGGVRGSHWRWHLDEVFVKIDGAPHYLKRAVDHDGEVLDAYVSKTRDRKSAPILLAKLLRRHG
jgi:putative transposase